MVMKWLLLFVPIAIVLEFLSPDRHLLIFVTQATTRASSRPAAHVNRTGFATQAPMVDPTAYRPGIRGMWVESPAQR